MWDAPGEDLPTVVPTTANAHLFNGHQTGGPTAAGAGAGAGAGSSGAGVGQGFATAGGGYVNGSIYADREDLETVR